MECLRRSAAVSTGEQGRTPRVDLGGIEQLDKGSEHELVVLVQQLALATPHSNRTQHNSRCENSQSESPVCQAAATLKRASSADLCVFRELGQAGDGRKLHARVRIRHGQLHHHSVQ